MSTGSHEHVSRFQTPNTRVRAMAASSDRQSEPPPGVQGRVHSGHNRTDAGFLEDHQETAPLKSDAAKWNAASSCRMASCRIRNPAR